MANSKEKKKGLKEEVVGIALLAVSLFIIVSLLSYSPSNVSSNWGGVVGGYAAWVLFRIVGLSAYLFPVLIIILALEFLIKREFNFRPLIPISLFFLLVSFSGILSSLVGSDTLSCGILGKYVCLFLWNYLSYTGTLIVLTAIFICSAIFATGISLVDMVGRGYNIYQSVLQKMQARVTEEKDEPIGEESSDLSTPARGVKGQRLEAKKADRPTIIMPPAPRKQPKPKEPSQEHFEFLKSIIEFHL